MEGKPARQLRRQGGAARRRSSRKRSGNHRVMDGGEARGPERRWLKSPSSAASKPLSSRRERSLTRQHGPTFRSFRLLVTALRTERISLFQCPAQCFGEVWRLACGLLLVARGISGLDIGTMTISW